MVLTIIDIGGHMQRRVTTTVRVVTVLDTLRRKQWNARQHCDKFGTLPMQRSRLRVMNMLIASSLCKPGDLVDPAVSQGIPNAYLVKQYDVGVRINQASTDCVKA